MALLVASSLFEITTAGQKNLKAPRTCHGIKRIVSSSSSRRRSLNSGLAVSAKAQSQILQEESTQIQTRLGRGSFPKDFLFGASTSAYQIEGAVNEGGRGPSIWDSFTHEFPEKIADGSNGDVACDSYHRYKEDVQLLKNLGLDAYRFSISWSRILPTGRGKVNEEGVRYYNNLINELLDNGILPFVTLFHWDLPQALHDEYGGFLGDKIAEDFKNYADVCFREFGDRVKHWITINEGKMFTTLGYGAGVHAPGRCTDGLEIEGAGILHCPFGDSLREPYIVAHNIHRAHAEAVHVYREKYQFKQNGKIGITQVSHWFVPIDDSPLSKDAQSRALQFNIGWFMDPLKFGDYPLTMRSLVGERLPYFTPEETQKLLNSYDFIGVNYYTARYARSLPLPKDFKSTSYIDDSRVEETRVNLDGIPIDHAEPGSWINVHPRGLRELLLYIKERYDSPTIYITENGVMEQDNKKLPLKLALTDTHRSEYLTLHIHELQEASRLGVDVRGYFTWSLLDNFEWHDGFKSRLGLHFIDFYNTHKAHLQENEKDEGSSPPNLRRIPKQSTIWFKRFLSIA
ncbi:Beta-glucosidase 12 [Platanthera guangdongensis]|uniref:Beta-glucosidase 12 n=1 Tax=Platanthera guangdongensis TaxID=2320717 RepID=A0ABR2MTY1_9ASPA